MTSFPLVRLSDLVLNVQTWNPLRSSEDDMFCYIDLSAVSQELKKITEPNKLKCHEAPSRARQLVKTNDVLVSTVRPNLNGVALVTSDFDGATASTGFCVLRPNPNRLNANYLFHWVKNELFVKSMVMQATGASYPAVSDKIVMESAIPLPDISEQRHIAAILDKADTLRVKRRDAVVELDRLTQSIFLDMFEEVKQIHEISSGITLGEFCDLFNGYAFKSTDYVEVSSTLNCRMSNIRPNGEFDVNYNPRFLPDSFANTYKEFLLKDGDVIIAMTDMANEPKILGVPTIVNTEGRILLLNQRVGKLIIKSPEKLRVTFLKQLLSQQYARKHLQKFGGGGLQINLGKKDILSTPIFVPDITKQIKFEKRLERLSQFRKNLEKSLRENDSLISSLQYLAFNGGL